MNREVEEKDGTSTVMAPMEVSRVTSGVPPSVLPHILGTQRWDWAAAAARGEREGEGTRGARGNREEITGGFGDISFTLQKQPSSYKYLSLKYPLFSLNFLDQ